MSEVPLTFDPFGDLDSRGYLRNRYGLKDLAKLQELEFIGVLDSLGEALEYLATVEYLEYRHVLEVHRMLFETIYPWAGTDRAGVLSECLPEASAVKKGGIYFAHPLSARKAVEHALGMGQNPEFFKTHPGTIMGYFAYGHPFLDGNGRTIMTIFTELAQRAGISVDWSSSPKSDYLAALTKELDDPDKGHLDSYLKPLIKPALTREELFAHLTEIPGLFKPTAPA